MTETITPIVRGALYRDTEYSDEYGPEIRVRSVWVDEDMSTQVSVTSDTDNHRTRRTVSLDDFIERLDETIVRVNSDHEAWEWRQ